MKKVYEVFENIYGYAENEKLWDSLEKAMNDFYNRIDKLKTELKMVSEDSVEIDLEEYLATLKHYPHQLEVEGESLSTDEATVKIWVRELY